MRAERSTFFTDFEAALEEAQYMTEQDDLGMPYSIMVKNGLFRVTKSNRIQCEGVQLQVGRPTPDPVDSLLRWGPDTYIKGEENG